MTNKIILKTVFIVFIAGAVSMAGLLVSRLFGGKPKPSDTVPVIVKNINLNQPSPTPTDCIVTVDNKQYNVTKLRNSHTGGDIFKCNTDMSTIFRGQHKDNLQMIEKFLIK